GLVSLTMSGLVPDKFNSEHNLPGCAESWRACAVSPWVLKKITKGYVLQFARSPPPFSRVIQSVMQREQSHFLREEIISLLKKKAINRIPLKERNAGFYSRYFLVPKRDGNYRPILDLRVLNKALIPLRFRMLTPRRLVQFIRPNDWFITIDLKDAYFHVPIHHRHRRFLRCAFGGIAYQFNALPFGLALAPRVFTKCVEAAIAPLRLRGLRLFSYLDDWLIAAHSKAAAVQYCHLAVAHLHRLGFVINKEKSVLCPSQTTHFLGMVLDSTSMEVRLSRERINAIKTCVHQFRLGQSVSSLCCQRLLGMMVSAAIALPLGMLRMQPFQ